MSLRIYRTIHEIRSAVSAARGDGRSIAFVPTMGALHAGHGALMESARRENHWVVVSIFVNPTQFGPSEDFRKYPRVLDQDVEFCRSKDVEAVFAPSVQEIYPTTQETFVEVSRLTDHLCGPFRPGHFKGVATVVAKLFHIVEPDIACFGQKDAQQLAIIQRMVRDLNLRVSIEPVATVREPDGLALSSRNACLTAEQRQAAPVLYRALQSAQQAIEVGEPDPQRALDRARAVLRACPGIRTEYLEAVDPDDLQPLSRIAGPALIAAAVWIGSTRLIDNVRCELNHRGHRTNKRTNE